MEEGSLLADVLDSVVFVLKLIVANPQSSKRNQGCSGAGTRWNAVPVTILERERRSGKYRWPQVER